MCYRQEVLTFSDPLFTDIKTSFLLTMEGSPRRAQYMRELARHRPTQTVVVLHNAGYRACAKPGWVETTAADLWHANLTAHEIFRRQYRTHRHESVLVLEDDVEFTPHLRAFAPVLEAFLARNKVHVYSLGSLPLLSAPVILVPSHSLKARNFAAVTVDHLRIYAAGTSHAYVYTASGMRVAKRLLNRTGLHDLDASHQLRFYTCARPCATQRFTATANSAVWNLWGVPLRYLRFFGAHVYPYHHFLGLLGGILPVYTVLVGTVLASLRRA